MDTKYDRTEVDYQDTSTNFHNGEFVLVYGPINNNKNRRIIENRFKKFKTENMKLYIGGNDESNYFL